MDDLDFPAFLTPPFLLPPLVDFFSDDFLDESSGPAIVVVVGGVDANRNSMLDDRPTDVFIP